MIKTRGIAGLVTIVVGVLFAAAGPSAAQLTPVTFAPPQTFQTSGTPIGLDVQDFNRDGRTDLATANFSSDDVSILLGGGDGTLAQAMNFPVGDRPSGIIAADFNRNGRLDLAVANSGTDNVSVMAGRVGGTFGPIQNFSVGDAPGSITAVDLNLDGRLDLATANFGSDNISVLLGRQNGFAPSQAFAVGRDPASIAGTEPRFLRTGFLPGQHQPVDFNRDGHPDLATANQGSNDVSVLLGNGDGTFQPTRTFPARGVLTSDIVAADFNHDGKQDLAVTNQDFATPGIRPDRENVAVLLGNGDGTFASAATFTAGDGPFALTAADLNRDGRLDLAVANFDPFSPSGGPGSISVLLGNDDGTFASPMNFQAPNRLLTAVVAADLNRDARLDLVVGTLDARRVSVFLNTSS
jgi:hypothetical protein